MFASEKELASENGEQRLEGETCVCCSLLGQNLNQLGPTLTSYTFSLKSCSVPACYTNI